MKNRTLVQFFEWYLPSDASLWNEVKEKAKTLSQLGITEVWLPPAYKGCDGKNDVGYGVYDMYDLGEFNQKGTIPTKYGTKEQYLEGIKTLQSFGIKVYADIVFNHRMGADETESIHAKVYEPTNRNQQIDEREILGWTKFTFPGRNETYSKFVWNHTHFDGCDWDARTSQKALYLFREKNWDDQVDIEKGNYDYLMGADLDFNNQEVFNELVTWGQWHLDVTGVDGFRIDAVKHINFPKLFQWFLAMKESSSKELFAVGEYWNPILSSLTYYLDQTAHSIPLFDVPLHYNLHKASTSNGHFDMRTIFENTLVNTRPNHAVTIVDNHDTQPGQALESWVAQWFKLHAYSLILLRKDGIPCVFYGDLYGIPNNQIPPVGSGLEQLIKVRANLAYGEQLDYLADSNIIGFTRLGCETYSNSGVAVILTNGKGGSLRMCMGEHFIGKTMIDCLSHCDKMVVIEADGCGIFPVSDGSVSVYILKDSL